MAANTNAAAKSGQVFYTLGYIVAGLAILYVIVSGLSRFESNRSISTRPTSSGQATSSSGGAVQAPVVSTKAVEIGVGTHVIPLKAGVKSQVFVFQNGAKGFRTSFSSVSCRKVFADGDQVIRNCGTERLTVPGKTRRLIFQADNDMDVIVTIW